jgi:predicted small secreted protein
MKKVFAFLAIAGVMSACNNDVKEAETKIDSAASSVTNAVTNAADSAAAAATNVVDSAKVKVDSVMNK